MTIKQISVFVENKTGRMCEITEILAKNNVDIRALSIADTTDYGVLRMIVSDPDAAVSVLRDAGHTVSGTEVLGISIPDTPGGFAKAIRVLTEKGINLEYAYAFITPSVGKAYVIIRVEDNDGAAKALAGSGVELIGQEDIF